MSEQAGEAAVVSGQEDEEVLSPSVAERGVLAKKPSAPRAAPKWEVDARDRVRAAVRRYSKPLADLVARDANEGDTRLLVTDFLCDGLGYDKYEELTTEYQVKGEFADYGIRIEKQLVAFIEVKRCSQKLNLRHLRQVQMYAVNEGVEWMILTNGQVWQVYHMTGGLPVVIDLALEVDLLGEAGLAAKTDALFYLSKEAFKRRLIDDLWKARAATSAKSLAQVVLSDLVIDAVRKEVRRQTNHNAEPKDLVRILRAEVLRSEALS
ncbi:Type I restriction enzyme R protein N terminus (HSDR_N) [Streptosporangium subroseum]|uniref:Type I restriction enzyme R protein N terminus (HSDR_N) n=1 Tax=Streptosporangium subroseum TaxID=106412 RepID=A0A239ICE3_9ACTN|nr:type I restriction enzyme HsdR N-terminal domain-containing protein [Streptosporangium subroseum]SNS90084.1 Type I restriction enzyme R protein N terminus (HSDR_N) [Streptosporangium subroseum]